VNGEILSVVGALVASGTFGYLIKAVVERRHMAGQADSVHIQNALALLEPYREQVADLRREMSTRMTEVQIEVEDLRKQNTELRADARRDRQELRELKRRERESGIEMATLWAWVGGVEQRAQENGWTIPPVPPHTSQRREHTRQDDFPEGS
jgi:ABC-type phosphate transport system auxiliary subunit